MRNVFETALAEKMISKDDLCEIYDTIWQQAANKTILIYSKMEKLLSYNTYVLKRTETKKYHGLMFGFKTEMH